MTTRGKIILTISFCLMLFCGANLDTEACFLWLVGVMACSIVCVIFAKVDGVSDFFEDCYNNEED